MSNKLGNWVHKMVRMMLVLAENMLGVHNYHPLLICHQLEKKKVNAHFLHLRKFDFLIELFTLCKFFKIIKSESTLKGVHSRDRAYFFSK